MNSYSISGYGHMVSDPIRVDAYVAALAKLVRPGSVVLDLGCGTGLMAMVAARCGAARVYGIEFDEAIELARRSVRVNGLDHIVTLLNARSQMVALPRAADLMVFDLRGVLPMYRGSLAAIIDARTRLLAPGGTVVPARDRILLVPCECDEAHREIASPWESRHGLDLSAGRRHAFSSLKRRRIPTSGWLAEPAVVATIDYAVCVDEPAIWRHTWTLESGGTVHGIAGWFETDLAPGIGYTTSPAAPETVYGSAFFPFEQPTDVQAGDCLCAEVRVDALGEDYCWRWVLDVYRHGKCVASRRQSTFDSRPLSLDRLRTMRDQS